ncbi:MAG TPA: serine/threonine-protein kinase [Kofleriaceae bacterium]|nr:serine/threonine-protein kinase [Kofleriaceae bacterium]
MAQKAPTKRPDPGVAIGHVFLGKYRVEEILGVGGMGVVTKCLHMQLGELVAIKMLRKDVLDDYDAVERFMREAQAAARLRSEYVARVIDVGRFESNQPYMIMEFLDGHDLGELLEERGFLPVPWATEMMMQAAEALAEAHSIGIVHRDVKPTNLFVTWRPDGSALIKVLDFGIARALIGNDLKLTQTQSLLGTPAYMSPEQMRSARLVDARSDIWSLGTVLYELIEGRRPFEAESFSEMCVKVAVDQPMPMKNAPPALQQVVLRCLSKTPEQRYANMAELGGALLPFIRDPKAGAILVERMQRMIERGAQIDWTAGTSAPDASDAPDAPAGTRTPAPGAGGTDAAHGASGEDLPIPAKIVMPPRAKQRRPRGSPDATLKGPPRRKAGILYVGAAALLGVGIGLLVFILGGGLRSEAEPAAAAKAAEQLLPVPAPAPAPAPAPVPPPLEDRVEVVVTPIEPPKPERPVQAVDRRPKPPRPLARPETPTVPPPPPPPCNPADHAHGCPKT